MAKIIWTQYSEGTVTTMTLPSGRTVALKYGENDVSDETYEEMVKLGILENKKPTTNKKKE
jgi:hypothetical protein